MTYLLCDESVQNCKNMEHETFRSVKDVEDRLLKAMNRDFGYDVFRLNANSHNKYVKIYCNVPHCGFDIWLTYSVDPDGIIHNLRHCRYIMQGHNPNAHMNAFD